LNFSVALIVSFGLDLEEAMEEGEEKEIVVRNKMNQLSETENSVLNLLYIQRSFKLYLTFNEILKFQLSLTNNINILFLK